MLWGLVAADGQIITRTSKNNDAKETENQTRKIERQTRNAAAIVPTTEFTTKFSVDIEALSLPTYSLSRESVLPIKPRFISRDIPRVDFHVIVISSAVFKRSLFLAITSTNALDKVQSHQQTMFGTWFTDPAINLSPALFIAPVSR